MRLLSKDFIVPSIACVVLSSAAFGLYHDFSYRGKGSTKEVGTVTFKKKKAERKFTDTADWETVEQNSPVYDSDSIRTTEGASAVLHLTDGSEIDLDENTLVVLKVSAGAASVDFLGGAIYAKKGDNSSALNIHSGKTSVDVASGSMSVAGTGEKNLSVNVSTGSSKVALDGKVVNVKGSQSVQVSDSGADLKPQEIVLTSPGPSAYFPTPRGTYAAVLFKWKSIVPAKIQIAHDRSFKKIIVSESKEDQYNATLVKGDYYWRIAADKGSFSETRKISVLEDSLVLTLSPKAGEIFPYRAQKPQILFKWSTASMASSYEIEVSKEKSFATQDVKVSSRVTSIVIDTLEEGKYFWRVRAVYPSGLSPPYAVSPDFFSVSKSQKIAPPELVFPPDGTKKSITAVSEGKVILNWKTNPEAQKYHVEISQDSEFAKSEISEFAAQGRFVVKNLKEEGNYYWRIRSVSADGSESDPSVHRSISLRKLFSVENLSAESDNNGSWIFRWKDLNESAKYRVELSPSKNFEPVQQSVESGSTRVSLKDLPAGRLFWRVISADSGGEEISRSSAAELVISESITAPVPVSPVNNQEIDVSKKAKIEFAWKEVPEATEYQFEIIRYTYGSEKSVYTSTSKKGKFDFSQFSVLSTGTFYWQVSALKRKGGFVAAKSVPAKGYFMIPAGPEILAPKVGSIRVIVE
jgi:hypothetical protein